MAIVKLCLAWIVVLAFVLVVAHAIWHIDAIKLTESSRASYTHVYYRLDRVLEDSWVFKVYYVVNGSLTESEFTMSLENMSSGMAVFDFDDPKGSVVRTKRCPVKKSWNPLLNFCGVRLVFHPPLTLLGYLEQNGVAFDMTQIEALYNQSEMVKQKVEWDVI